MLSGTVVKLSAIIITRNEADNIGACLEGVAFCDERIVVDSGSDDDTVRIARAAGATVVTHAWAGFGAQKNFALSQARGEWVLSIDADERVSAPLAAEILSTIGSARANGYEVARLSTFLGRPMRHSGWFPDYVLRLFVVKRRDLQTTLCTSGSSATARSGGLRACSTITRCYDLKTQLAVWTAIRRQVPPCWPPPGVPFRSQAALPMAYGRSYVHTYGGWGFWTGARGFCSLWPMPKEPTTVT